MIKLLSRLITSGCLFACVAQLYAQDLTLTGIVTDEKDLPLVGVNINIVGSSTLGTITDIDGKFTLQSPVDAFIRFSYLGYDPQEVRATATPMIIRLKEIAVAVEEVVVTALGIQRDKKALSYSVTELKDDMFKVKDSNLAAGLAGKVSGVNVVRPTTGAMGSSRITIRGNGSFGGNQPLYVVDGVPIDNSTYGQPGVWGGVDGGDGISSFNSDDIESLTVLKGGTAAALYGSRAANGAIVIKTKKGLKGKTTVELSTSYSFDKPIVKKKDIQRIYGQGLSNMAPFSFEMAQLSGPASWGAKLDGSDVIQFDGVMRPYVDAGKDNFTNFYGDAWSLNNNLSVSAGGESTQYRLSIGDQRYDDLYPNSTLGRNNVTLNLTSELSKRVTLQISAMYMRERVKNRQSVNDYASNGNVLLWTLPVNMDIRTLSPAVDEQGNELLLSNMYIYFANPYFVAYNRHQEDAKDRTFGSVQLQYDITDDLFLRGKAGADMISRRSETIVPKGTGYNLDGSFSANNSFSGEFNGEVLLGYSKRFGEKWSTNTFAGWNTMASWNESISAHGDRFIQPNFPVIGNTETTTGGKYKRENYINSIFGQIEVSYYNVLYLTLTGRNDWFSALSLQDKTTPNSIFYPSAGLGVVVSDAMRLPSWISFLKLRGSWAESGGAISPYNLALTYRYGQSINGRPTGSIATGTIPNIHLKPLTSITYEAGVDVRFLKNRLGLDLTYYVRNTQDDIVTAQISSASGYDDVLINAGKINNNGIEALLSATPIQTKTVEWNTSVNFSYNKSEIKRITDNVNNFIVERSRTGAAGDEGTPAYIYQEVGQPYGIIKGSSYVRDENNQLVFDNNGLPLKGEIKKLGEGVHPYTAGFSNSLSYRRFTLSFLVDGKFGGSVFSGTNTMAYFLGTHIETVKGREEGVVGKGVRSDGSVNTQAVPAMEYYMHVANNITEEFVYDASFIKLREISFTYNLPETFLRKLSISNATLSLVGRNLFTLYSKMPMVDPESGYTSGNAQGLEQWELPATRSFGFNLNVHF